MQYLNLEKFSNRGCEVIMKGIGGSRSNHRVPCSQLRQQKPGVVGRGVSKEQPALNVSWDADAQREERRSLRGLRQSHHFLTYTRVLVVALVQNRNIFKTSRLYNFTYICGCEYHLSVAKEKTPYNIKYIEESLLLLKTVCIVHKIFKADKRLQYKSDHLRRRSDASNCLFKGTLTGLRRPTGASHM